MEEKKETSNYDIRLDMISESVKELKAMVTKTNDTLNRLALKDFTIQENKIKELDARIDGHIVRADEKLKLLEGRVLNLEEKPLKDNANKWQAIIDYIFKAIVTIGVGAILVKAGLQ